MTNESYLGDGLYATYDGFMFTLRAPRGNQYHYVSLEPDVLDSFLKFIEKTQSVKILITRENESGAV